MTSSALGPVVLALDSFKGSIAAADAVAAVRAGWASIRTEDDVLSFPMADGGEGTLEAFATAVPGAVRMPVHVTGPHGRRVAASWVLLPASPLDPGGCGVIELASTSGIEMLGTPPRLRPLDADTRGFGEAIAAALAQGVTRLVLGLGSSASTDGGVGMLTALGGRFADASGRVLRPGGGSLEDVTTVDLSGLPPLPLGGVTALTDVTNPLLGSAGAVEVFGPQKGARAPERRILERGLVRLAGLVDADPAAPGAGAAGGAGFGLLAWGAHLVAGAPAIADFIGLPDAVARAGLVITGEGSFDAQTEAGKVPDLVRSLGRAAGVPVVLVAGRIAPDTPLSGFAHAVSLTSLAGSSDEAIREPARWLRAAGAELARRAGPV